MKLFKLTNSRNQTFNHTYWGENITHTIPKKNQGKKLCTMEVLHAYKSLNLALLLNPIHSDFKDFKVWDAEGDVVVEDWGKVGCWELTTLKQLKLPDWYRDEWEGKRVRIRFAILCAEKVLKYFEEAHPEDQRPRKAIHAARDFLKATEPGKLKVDAHNISEVSKVAADAANDAAAHSASGAAACAAYTAALSADAASDDIAAYTAYTAARTTDDYSKEIDFLVLADKAVSKENI